MIIFYNPFYLLNAATQYVYLFPPEQLSCSYGGYCSLEILYYTSDGSQTDGVGIRIHYNSFELTFHGHSNVYHNLISNEVFDDYNDFDDDASTDKYASLAWYSFSKSWPGIDMPVKLADITFIVNTNYTHLNITFSSFSSGYTENSGGAIIMVPCGRSGYISGKIFPCNENLFSNTKISTWDNNTLNSQTRLLPGCYFFITHDSGSFTLIASSKGYDSVSKFIEVPELQTINVDIYLQESVSLNNDDKVDLKYVIKLMQFLSK